MPYDPVLRFKKSPSLDVTKYSVAWTRDGVAAGAGEVARNLTGDSNAYAVKFSVHNPNVILSDGETVGVSLRAVYASGLASAAVEPVVTMPSTPPEPPTNVTLTVS